MKKIVCFSVATFTSVLMFISAALSFRLSRELAATADVTGIGFIILQVFLLTKYIVGTVILMPNKVSLNQLALGFLTADLTAVALGVFYGSFLVIPAVLVQIIIIGGYRHFENMQMITIHIEKLSQTGKGLLTEGI